MKKREDMACEECGKMFHPTRKGSRFCCRACGIKYNTEHGVLKKSDEQKKVLSELRKGKTPWNKGKKTSPEQIAKFKESIKGTWTEEKRLEQSRKQKEVWSNEDLLEKHRQKMIESHNTPEYRKKLAEKTIMIDED